jgi:hypothetical protein
LNDTFLHDPSWNVPVPAGARILWGRPHPFDYLPYLFEGYGEQERNSFSKRERSMKVLRFDGVQPIRGFPYAFKLAFSPRSRNALDVPEPILASGSKQAGDLIFLKYNRDGTGQIGWDHWGSPARLSAPFSFERNRDHTIVVIAPCLLGNAAAGLVGRPDLGRWMHRVYVSVDGATAMYLSAYFYPTDEFRITVGLNLIDASTAQESLELETARFSAIDDGDWARAESAWGG